MFLNNNKFIGLNDIDYDGMSGFILACNNNNIEIVKLLLNDDRINSSEINFFGYDGFCYSCINGYNEICCMIIKNKNFIVNRQYRYKFSSIYINNYFTPFTFAYNCANIVAINELIKRGVQVTKMELVRYRNYQSESFTNLIDSYLDNIHFVRRCLLLNDVVDYYRLIIMISDGYIKIK